MNQVRPLIYVVDDNDDYRFIVSQVFKRSLTQYRTQYFNSGRDLCKHIESDLVEVPWLILIDYDMPGLNGPQTIAFLKQQASWKEVPMIIVSSGMSPEEQQIAYNSGADSYRQKPTTLNQLQSELGQLCDYWAEVCVETRRYGVTG